jgi:hypothetical protein
VQRPANSRGQKGNSGIGRISPARDLVSIAQAPVRFLRRFHLPRSASNYFGIKYRAGIRVNANPQLLKAGQREEAENRSQAKCSKQEEKREALEVE